MKLIEKKGDAVVLQCSSHEAFMLHGAMRETLEALQDWEFSTRMGAEIEEFRLLCGAVRDVVDGLKSSSGTDESHAK